MFCSKCSPCCRSFCAWAGSAVLISGFIVGIGLSLTQMWPLALGLSTLFILVLVIWVRKYHKSLQVVEDSSAVEEDDSSTPKGTSIDTLGAAPGGHPEDLSSNGLQSTEDTPLSDSKAIPLALSILYILLVCSLATPGAILSLKAIPCYRYEHQVDEPQPWPTPASTRIPYGQSFWTTDNFKDLLPEVRAWIDTIDYKYGAEYRNNAAGKDMFCQIGDTIYFGGKELYHETSTSLIAASGSDPASKVEDFYNPTWITQVAGTTCCFLLKRGSMTRDEILCGDKDNGFDRSVSLTYGAYPAVFTEINGLLWFVQTRPSDLHAIVSLNITTMDMSLHIDERPDIANEEEDYLTPEDYDDAWAENYDNGDYSKTDSVRECDGVSTGQVIGGLFMSALPIVAVSIWLWKKGIPSSSFTLYVGLGLVFQFITTFGDYYFFPTGFMAWFVIGTPMWILATAFVIAVNKRGHRSVLYFGLYSISSFAVFFVLGVLITSVVEGAKYEQEVYSDEIEVWFMLTVLAFVPLILVGIVVESLYIYILGMIGIIVIVSAAILRLSHLSIAASASIWAVTILVLILIGYIIHSKRVKIHDKITSCLGNCVGHTYEVANAGEGTGLLPNGEATET